MPSLRDPLRNGTSPTKSTNPVLERAQSQWLFTPSELLRTPSILEGIPVAQELANRQKGVNFITQVGIMLKLPQLTLATASVYLHRFFVRHAMAQPNKPGLHHYSVAATALFLATKVEENCRKMRELVVACCRVAQKQPNLVVDEQSKEYWKWRDTILHNEDLLLEALCFDLQLEQPYRILFDFLCYYHVQDNKTLRNTSWAFLNDSHATTLCLQLMPRAIAGSALYVGAKLAGVTLPDNEQERPWWEHLDLDIREIQQACNLMADVYQNPALPRQGQKDAYTRDDDISLFDKTRHATTPRPDRSPAQSTRSESQGIKRERDSADDRQSEEWGSTSTATRHVSGERPLPSPKRPRRDSTGDHGRAPAPPLPPLPSNVDANAPVNPRGHVVDHVQQRIDDIVNASTSSQNNPPPHPLSRRPSHQPIWQGPPPRRRSSSGSNWQRPPSSGSNGYTGHQDRGAVPVPRSSHDRGPSEPGGKREHSTQPTWDQRDEGRLPNQQYKQERQTRRDDGMNDIDDAERVDYGSEEGEL